MVLQLERRGFVIREHPLLDHREPTEGRPQPLNDPCHGPLSAATTPKTLISAADTNRWTTVRRYHRSRWTQDCSSAVAMAADGAIALVGARWDDDPNGDQAGAAYVFKRSGGLWTQQAKLAPAEGDEDDNFEGSVAMTTDGTTAIVGALEDERSGGSWRQ